MRRLGKLTWTADANGFRFKVIDPQGVGISPEQWALHEITSSDDDSVSTAPLLGLIEDEVVNADSDQSIDVSHQLVAAFEEYEVAQLKLPPSAPVRLKISGKGILTSSQFRFQYQLLKADGTPVMGFKRNGALVQIGTRQHLLLDPLYSLIQGMEEFNAIPPGDMDSRMLRWSEMKHLLPEDAVVDNSLRSMNVVLADSFTLDIDDRGDFSPELLHKPPRTSKADEIEEPKCGEPALPGGPQKDFQKRFRTQSRARRYYTAAGGWFIVIPKHLAKALEIVKEKQNASFGERQAFIANPSAILKERLEDEYSEDEIESFFEETPEFLSARVSHLGVWEPKQNVYIMGSGQKWLPDDNEAFGVMLGDSLYSINPGDIPDVYDELELAKKQGEKSVGYHEQNIPVTEESLETFGRLSQSIRRSASGKDELNESDKPGQKARWCPSLSIILRSPATWLLPVRCGVSPGVCLQFLKRQHYFRIRQMV